MRENLKIWGIMLKRLAGNIKSFNYFAAEGRCIFIEPACVFGAASVCWLCYISQWLERIQLLGTCVDGLWIENDFSPFRLRWLISINPLIWAILLCASTNSPLYHSLFHPFWNAPRFFGWFVGSLVRWIDGWMDGYSAYYNGCGASTTCWQLFSISYHKWWLNSVMAHWMLMPYCSLNYVCCSLIWTAVPKDVLPLHPSASNGLPCLLRLLTQCNYRAVTIICSLNKSDGLRNPYILQHDIHFYWKLTQLTNFLSYGFVGAGRWYFGIQSCGK